MPPMTLLGWFHTVMGVIAILTAAYTLYQHRIIRAADKSGRAYLLITLVVAGYLLETLAPFGKWSVYLQTGAYTATVLFHMIPAITDFLRRLPVGDPFVDSLDAPLVQSFHLAFLAAFVVGVLAQWMWLTRARG